ncbi:2-amino-4-hydroxy-6-hydroxymethyldihydropteridine diphosphokinase [Yoonia sp. MH D7]
MPQAQIKSMTGNNALIALGSNANSLWGDSTETIQKSMLIVGIALAGNVEQSALYTTPAFPAGTGPDFVNAAIRVQTTLNAAAIMQALHDIEADAGRKRVVRWGQRTLDLDLIALDDMVRPDADTHQKWRDLPLDQQVKTTPDQLIIPHPRLQDRSFVLVPLADIAPDWVHPLLNLSVTQMRDARPLDEIAGVRPI